MGSNVKQPALRNQSVKKREKYIGLVRLACERKRQTDGLSIFICKEIFVISECIAIIIFNESACYDVSI